MLAILQRQQHTAQASATKVVSHVRLGPRHELVTSLPPEGLHGNAIVNGPPSQAEKVDQPRLEPLYMGLEPYR